MSNLGRNPARNPANLGRNLANLGRNPANLGRNSANPGRKPANQGEINANAESFKTTLSEANGVVAQLLEQMSGASNEQRAKFEKLLAVAKAAILTTEELVDNPNLNPTAVLANKVAEQPEINMTTAEVKAEIEKSIRNKIRNLRKMGVTNNNPEMMDLLGQEQVLKDSLENKRSRLSVMNNGNNKNALRREINVNQTKLGSELSNSGNNMIGGRKVKKNVKKPTKKITKK
jgi:hypothetical protein